MQLYYMTPSIRNLGTMCPTLSSRTSQLLAFLAPSLNPDVAPSDDLRLLSVSHPQMAYPDL